MLEALRQIGGLVGRATCRDVWVLSDGELVTALEAVHAVEQRLAAVKLSLVREVDGRGIAATDGASSTVVWLRERLRISGTSARRAVELAAGLAAGPAVVRDALVAGGIGVEQARVISQVVLDLPAHAGAEVVAKAAQVLVEQSQRFEPSILRRLGQRILHHVAPDLAEEGRAGRPAPRRTAGTGPPTPHPVASQRER